VPEKWWEQEELGGRRVMRGDEEMEVWEFSLEE